MRRLGRALITLAVAGFLALGLAGPAVAHAGLASSDPAASAMLDRAPSQVTMTFTEPPDPALSIVHVLDVNGTPVEAGPARSVPGQEGQLRIALPADLPDGVYTVNWRVVSEADGHATAGAFSFGVNVAPGTVVIPSAHAPTTPPPSVASVAGKLLLYVGLALSFAAAVVGLRAFRGQISGRRWVLRYAATAAVVGGITMLLSERATLGVPMGGHAAAAATPALQIGLQWLHFMAASVWMGGLALTFVLLRARRRAEGGVPVDEVRAYSSLAGYALAVVLVTGLLRATQEVGGVSKLFDLFRGSYGTTLDVKVSIVVILIVLGAISRYRAIPRMEARPGLLRRVMAVELVGAVGVFSLTGMLTGLAPRPPVTPPAPAPARVTLSGSDFATTMKVSLVVTPGAAGPNGFDVDVTDFDSGAPVDATDVSLRFEPVGRAGVGTSTLGLENRGAQWTGSGSQVSIAGVWTITVVVQTPSSGTEIPLTLITSIPGQTVAVATAAGQPDIYTIAFPDGEQLQLYNDPGTPGTDELHLTAFDADGVELPLARAEMVAVAPDGTASSLPPRRFSAGHFVGDLTLTAGEWTFFVQAMARDGRVLVASFEQSI